MEGELNNIITDDNLCAREVNENGEEKLQINGKCVIKTDNSHGFSGGTNSKMFTCQAAAGDLGNLHPTLNIVKKSFPLEMFYVCRLHDKCRYHSDPN